MRTLLAGIAAGIAMFIWSSIAHVATPLGTAGISTLPDESVTVGNLASAIGDKGGLYLFPMPSGGSAPSSSAATAPGGFLVFNDFAHIDPCLGTYGVHRAVVDFAVTQRWTFAWLAYQESALYDVALRRPHEPKPSPA